MDEKITDFYYAGTENRSDCQWNVGKKYVIKTGTNPAGLEKHIKISRALAEHGFCASLPVKTTDGRDYHRDGELYFCVENKLEGSPIKSSSLYDETYDFTPRYLGEVIGQLDLLLAGFNDDFVRGNENIIGVTDFELSEKNVRIFDPCYAATAVLSENFSKTPQSRKNGLTFSKTSLPDITV